MSRYPWSKLHHKGAGNVAVCPVLSLDTRVLMLAMSRTTGQGAHATFAEGEMAALLPRMDTKTGEVTPYSERQIRRAIRALVEAGALAVGSSTRCMVVPFDLLDSTGAAGRCPVHGRKLAWIDGEWIDPKALSKRAPLVSALTGA